MTDAHALGIGALRETNFRWPLGAQWASLIGDYMVLAAPPFAVFAGATVAEHSLGGPGAWALILS